MNSDSNSRLHDLESRQRHLNDEVARLRSDLVALRREMDAELSKAESSQGDPFDAAAPKSTPPPLPRSVQTPAAKVEVEAVVKKAAPKEKSQPVVSKEPKKPAPDRDVEMELGRVWLVRIGVGLLVTALVFFSTYAYQNYVLKMTPGGRLTVLMAAAFSVMGAGLWCETKRKLFQFGQVLISGAMAGVYYLTYASHHVEKLRVLESPTVAAVLMTVWTALMLGYATWRKSQVAAVMSVLLAGYAVVINPIGGLALFSALLLAIAAMVLMRRFGWMVLGAVSLAATYLGFAIWQMTNAEGNGGVEFTALCGYWVVFTASLLLGRRATAESVEGSAPWLSGTRWQSCFATANNALFFGLLVVDLRAMVGGGHDVIRDPFWIYPMGFGLVLLVVMAVLWLRVGWKAPLTQLYLAKGLGLVTLGMVTKLSGYQRHLSLIVEACLMMAAVVFRSGGRVVRAAAWAVLVLASFFALRAMDQESHLSALVFWGAACGFAVLAMLDARGRQPVETDTGTMPSQSFAELPVISGIAVMIGGWAFGLSEYWASVGVLSVVFAVIAGSYVLERWKDWRCAAVVNLHEWLIPLTLVMTIFSVFADAGSDLPLALSCGLAASGVVVHLMRRRGDDGMRDDALSWVSFPLVVVCALLTWISYVELGDWQMVGGMVAAVGLVELGRRFSLGSLRVSGIILLLLSVFGVLGDWAMRLPTWSAVIVPVTMLVVVALFERENHMMWRRALRILSSVLLLLTCFAFFVGMKFIGAGLLLGVVALALLMAGRKIRAEEFLGVGLLGVVAALITVALKSVDDGVPLWLAGGAVLMPVLVHLVWKVRSDEMSWTKGLLPSAVTTPAAAVAVFAAIVLLTAQVTQRFDGEGHAVIWAVIGIAAMILGFALQERGYRLPALAVLGLALGHVLLVDVWQFNTLGRVLSFSALGVAMILVGFFYNRFQEMLMRVTKE